MATIWGRTAYGFNGQVSINVCSRSVSMVHLFFHLDLFNIFLICFIFSFLVCLFLGFCLSNNIKKHYWVNKFISACDVLKTASDLE